MVIAYRMYFSLALKRVANQFPTVILILWSYLMALCASCWNIGGFIDALYDLILESGRIIDVTPVEKQKYEAGEFALYRNARQEGVLL